MNKKLFYSLSLCGLYLVSLTQAMETLQDSQSSNERYVMVWREGDWWGLSQRMVDEAGEFGVSPFDGLALRRAKRELKPQDKMRRFVRDHVGDFSWKPHYGSVFHVMAQYRQTDTRDFSLKWLERYYEIGVDPKAIDNQGRTALHIIALYHNNHWVNYVKDFVAKLMVYGVSLEATDDAGNTCLDYFASQTRADGKRESLLKMLDITYVDKVMLLVQDKK